MNNILDAVVKRREMPLDEDARKCARFLHKVIKYHKCIIKHQLKFQSAIDKALKNKYNKYSRHLHTSTDMLNELEREVFWKSFYAECKTIKDEQEEVKLKETKNDRFI